MGSRLQWWGPKGAGLRAAWFSLVFAVAASAAAQSGSVATESASFTADGSERFGEALRAAQKAHQREEYAQAAAHFREAARWAPTASVQAQLWFNAGIAAHQAEQWQEAIHSFDSAVATYRGVDEQEVMRSELHAGLCLVQLGRLDEAEQRLSSEQPSDPDLAVLWQQLAKWLEQSRSQAARLDFIDEVEEAARQFRAGDAASALLTQQAALAEEREQAARLGRIVATVEDLSTAWLLLGHIHMALGEPEPATRAYAQSAANLDASDVHLAWGDALQLQGDAQAAEHQYGQAEELARSEAERQAARERRLALLPVDPPGVRGSTTLLTGLSTNAGQAGANDSLGLSSGSQTVSALADLSLGLEGVISLAERARASLFYQGTGLLFFASDAQETSLQGHLLGAGWQRALSLRTRASLELSAGTYFSGLNPEPFLFSPAASLRVRHFPSASTLWAAGVSYGHDLGLGDQEVLTGHRAQLDADWVHTAGKYRVGAGAFARLQAMGTSEIVPTEGSLPACARTPRGRLNLCDGTSLYVIPLGTFSPGLNLSGARALSARWDLGLSAGLEARQYLKTSYLTPLVGPGSGERRLGEKRRLDFRLSWGSELSFRPGAQLRLIGRYQGLRSFSNMASGAEGPEHAWDYDDRRFFEHVASGGVAWEF